VIDVAGPVWAWTGRTAAAATFAHSARSNAVLVNKLAGSRNRRIGRDEVRRACALVIQMVIPGPRRS